MMSVRISTRALDLIRKCSSRTKSISNFVLFNRNSIYVCGNNTRYCATKSQFGDRPDPWERNQDFDQDSDDYDAESLQNEKELDALRKQHREESRQYHVVDEGVKFSDFNLNPKLQSRLDQLGYKTPFDIQVKTLEHTMQGRDVIGRAVTGSGKTLAFSIPIIQKLSQTRPTGRSSGCPRAIVISPTRELCLQIHRSVEELDSYVRCVALYGGDSYRRQENAIRRGIDVVCATPGRLNDHIQRGNINLEQVQFLCLDEADELLTPNFKEQIQDVLDDSPSDKQMMLFSATLPPDIRRVTQKYMKDAVLVDITKDQKYKGPESVKHKCIRVPEHKYVATAQSLINDHKPQRCIVFIKTKAGASRAAMILSRNGFDSEALHSDVTQSGRERILNNFRKGRFRILTATDVAARGLDIPECDLVIQAGPPNNGADFYLHRSGRTGRAGRDGLAIMLHDGRDRDLIRQVERMVDLEHINYKVEIEETSVSNVVESLQRVSEYDKAKTIAVAKTLDLSGDKGHDLMASALALVMKGMSGGDRYMDEEDYRGNDNGGRGYRGNDYGGRGYRGNDNGGRGYRGNDNGGRGYDKPYRNKRDGGDSWKSDRHSKFSFQKSEGKEWWDEE